MILTPYVYKDHLPLSDRLAIAQTYVRFDGYHGLVTELATVRRILSQSTPSKKMSSKGSLPSYPAPSQPKCLI